MNDLSQLTGTIPPSLQPDLVSVKLSNNNAVSKASAHLSVRVPSNARIVKESSIQIDGVSLTFFMGFNDKHEVSDHSDSTTGKESELRKRVTAGKWQGWAELKRTGESRELYYRLDTESEHWIGALQWTGDDSKTVATARRLIQGVLHSARQTD